MNMNEKCVGVGKGWNWCCEENELNNARSKNGNFKAFLFIWGFTFQDSGLKLFRVNYS